LLLQQLERRLDNVVSASLCAVAAPGAPVGASRTRNRHGKKVNIPSFEVSAGHEIAIRESSKKLTVLELAKEFAAMAPCRIGSKWIATNTRLA